MTEAQHDTTDPGGQGPRVSTEQMRDIQRLHRSRTDRRIAGVAGGIGRHLDVDPTVIRVLLVVLAFFGGAGLLIYGAAWLLVPEEGSEHAVLSTGAEARTAVLVAALVVAALLLLGDAWWLGFNEGWPPPLPLGLVVVAVVGYLLWRNRGQTAPSTAQPSYDGPPPPPAGAPPHLPPQPRSAPPAPPGQSLFGMTMALVLLALGVVAAVQIAGVGLPWAAYPATALVVVGVAMVTGAFVGRSTGLTFVGLLVAAVLAVATWTPGVRVGETVAHPSSAALLQDGYSYTTGRIHLDLTDVENLGDLDGRTLDLTMLAGDVVVELPTGLDVDVSSEAEGGQLDILGELVEGSTIRNDRSTGDTAAPDLRINVDLGFGHARVSTP
ncbi:MAG: PspC domain-containing protein [Nocardioidaceae bacterium]